MLAAQNSHQHKLNQPRSLRRQRKGGSVFRLKMPGGVGNRVFSQEGGGAGRVSAGNFGGEGGFFGAKIPTELCGLIELSLLLIASCHGSNQQQQWEAAMRPIATLAISIAS